MRCPTLAELPPPPAGKTGWPWTVASPQLPDAMPDGKPWPRISIVTPSYNQGQFIEETIRSVLLQGYPNLQYIVMDGGSTDGTTHILRKYESWFAHCVSRPDDGQTSAINSGFALADGFVLNWLNSDDLLLPRTLKKVGLAFAKDPGAVWYGDRICIDAKSRWVGTSHPCSELVEEYWLLGQPVAQESTFFSRAVYLEVGPLDSSLRFAMDYEFLSKAFAFTQFRKINKFLGAFRLHDGSKTSTMDEVMWSEFRKILVGRGKSQPSNYALRHLLRKQQRGNRINKLLALPRIARCRSSLFVD